MDKRAPTANLMARHPVEDERRIIDIRRVTAAEHGGSAFLAISLPRISMHVAFRAEAAHKPAPPPPAVRKNLRYGKHA